MLGCQFVNPISARLFLAFHDQETLLLTIKLGTCSHLPKTTPVPNLAAITQSVTSLRRQQCFLTAISRALHMFVNEVLFRYEK